MGAACLPRRWRIEIRNQLATGRLIYAQFSPVIASKTIDHHQNP